MMEGMAIQSAAGTTRSRPDAGHGMMILAQPRARIRVNPDIAMTYSAVWGSIRVVSDAMMTLPCRVVSTLPSGNQEVVKSNDGVDVIIGGAANEEMSTAMYISATMVQVMLHGNSLAEIETNGNGEPVSLWPIDWGRVNLDRDRSGRLVYDIINDRAPNSTLRASDVIHIRGMSKDGIVGYSVVKMARESISLGLAAEGYGASFFGNGAVPSLAISLPGGLSPGAQDNLKESFLKRNRGPSNWQSPLILEDGMSIDKLTIPPEDAQFLETRTFQVRDICRWYGVPPPFLGDLADATFSNVEQLYTLLVTGGIVPWVKRLDSELTFKLFQRRGIPLKVRHNVNGLLRGDVKTRGEFYKKLRDLGVLSVNDILRLEKMATIGDDGDMRLVPQNMVPLDMIREVVSNQGRKSKGSPSKGGAPDGSRVDAMAPVFAHAAQRIAKCEANAIKKAAKTRDAETLRQYVQVWFRDDRHIARLTDELGPALESAATLTGQDDCEIEACVRLLAESGERLVLASIEDDVLESTLGTWLASRTNEICGELMDLAGLGKAVA